MIEKERKFLLKYLPDECFEVEEIQQGYLLQDGKNHLRVRIIGDKRGFLTYKNVVNSILKNEYEYEIPLKDARELFSICPYKLEKRRYKTRFEENAVDIDIYPNGLKIVEIEFENELNKIPDYCGEDVSDDIRFSNIEIAMKNITTV